MTNFRRVLEALDEHDVMYVVVGGVALGLQGSSYRTQDIDIVYARDERNIARLVDALKRFRPRLRVEGEPEGLSFVFDVRSILNGGNFTMMTDIGDVDILATIAGLGDYEKLSAYVDEIAVLPAGKPTRVLSLDGLILAKKAANRPKDLLVLPELESMRELRSIEQGPE